jgi:carbon monoxide dehydrogenase subunit G
MELTNEFSVAAPVEHAWAALLDVERIAPCMPGAALTSFDGDAFTGTVKVKLGPVNLTYAGKGRFASKDEAAHRIVIEASGKDKRGTATAAATVTGTLYPEGDSTRVHVVTDLRITGAPAQFGRGMIADVAGRLVGQFAACLAEKIAANAPAPAEATPADTATTAAITAPAATPEPAAASATAVSATAAPAVADPAPPAAAESEPVPTAESMPAAEPAVKADPVVRAEPVAEAEQVPTAESMPAAEPVVKADPAVEAEPVAKAEAVAAPGESEVAPVAEAESAAVAEQEADAKPPAVAKPVEPVRVVEPIDLLAVTGASAAVRRTAPYVVTFLVGAAVGALIVRLLS